MTFTFLKFFFSSCNFFFRFNKRLNCTTGLQVHLSAVRKIDFKDKKNLHLNDDYNDPIEVIGEIEALYYVYGPVGLSLQTLNTKNNILITLRCRVKIPINTMIIFYYFNDRV